MNTLAQTDLDDFLPPAPSEFKTAAFNITRAVSVAARALERSSIPVLSHVLLTWGESEGTVTGTDMEFAIAVTFNCMGGSGACVVPGEELLAAVKRLPSESFVTLAQISEGADLVVTCGRFRATLHTLPVADYPALSAGPLPCRFTLPPDEFAGLLDATRFAVATSELRAYLCGVYLHVVGQELRAVATNGAMLAKDCLPWPKKAPAPPSVIIPTKTVAEIRKILDDVISPAVIELSESRIRVTAGAVALTSKLIGFEYPDYNAMIPAAYVGTLSCRTKELARVVEAVGALSDVSLGFSAKGAVVTFDISESGVEVSSYKGTKGAASDTLDCVYTGVPLRLGLMARDVLAVCGVLGERCEIAFAGTDRPEVVTDPDREGLLYLLTPFRV